MIGQAEAYVLALFALELVDVNLIEVPRDAGVAKLSYVRERAPTPDNGFSSVRLAVGVHDRPYKLLLSARRPGDPGGPVMEIDVGLGVDEFEGRLYLTADDENLRSVTEWARTGRLPGVYRPPGHAFDPAGLRNLPTRVPADWVCIVRPR